MISTNGSDEALRDELNQAMESLKNNTKMFEDLEFQYLEEETDWLAYREELDNEQKTLSRRMDEKRKQIQSLEEQGINDQNTACIDTKNIEKDLWSLLNNLEKCREELKTIDTLLFDLSGQTNTASDSDDEFSMATFSKRPHGDIMSQSLIGSQEILNVLPNKKVDLMSKSVNENMFANGIEMPLFNGSSDVFDSSSMSDAHKSGATYENFDASTPKRKTSNSSMNGEIQAFDGEDTNADDKADPLQKLKYNLSPPFSHKAEEEIQISVNLNLSIESDDFEVNPLEKRVPSQDDIDRICKITSDAPISTQGASYKVIESIKEIERNRQLLLTQQGEL